MEKLIEECANKDSLTQKDRKALLEILKSPFSVEQTDDGEREGISIRFKGVLIAHFEGASDTEATAYVYANEEDEFTDKINIQTNIRALPLKSRVGMLL